MTTTRAKRMAKALENYGWVVDSRVGSLKYCDACKESCGMFSKFCQNCGAKFPKKSIEDNRGLVELELSIAYALGETKRMPK